MAIETERKFLAPDNDSFLELVKGAHAVKIEQGYLMLSKDRQLRIRIIDKRYDQEYSDSIKAWICYKQNINKHSKHEFEYEVCLDDAAKLMELAECKISKYRWPLVKDGINVDVDMYYTLDNLVVIELEYDGELKEIPYFCGEEVTGVKEYSNIYLAQLNSV